jgi:hypothetical protein
MHRVATALVVGLIVVAGGLAGCGRNGQPQTVPTTVHAAAPSSPAVTAPSRPATPSPTVIASASGFPVDYAVPCQGRPTVDAVLAALHAGKVLPSQAAATATTGPLCSGDWQYTVLEVADEGTLLVVTRLSGTSLTLVTAGTDVCTTAVTGQAPAGLRAIAHCF